MSARSRAVVAVWVALALLAGSALLVRGRAQPAPTVVQASTSRHEVRVTAHPPTSGSTAVEVELTGVGGVSSGVTAVRLEPTMTQMGHALPPVAAQPPSGGEAGGSYRADVLLDMSGSWELHVVIDDARGTERLPVPLRLTR